MTEHGPQFVVIGAAGMLGRAWCALLTERGHDHLPLDREEVDITDPASIGAAVPTMCRAIINCAAYTDVDSAEADEAAATTLNAEAVAHLAAHARAGGATLIHYSTDYVFNGQATEPYPSDAPHDPVNAYGRGKAAGERALWASGADHLLIRTSWLYAPWGSNFVRTMLRLTAQRDGLSVVDDQVGRPTSAEHLAATSLALLDAGGRGTFHVTDGGQCTWHGFAAEIARQAGHTCDIRPCTSEQFVRPAKRPAYSVLDLRRTESLVGPMPDWKQNLAAVLARVEPVNA